MQTWVLSDACNKSDKINPFLKNYTTSEGAVSHNLLYYQQPATACYHVSFYAKLYFYK